MADAQVQGAAAVETVDAMTEAPSEPEVSDSMSWQERAEAAEQKLAEVAERLGEVEKSATELHTAMESQRSERLLDVLLVRAGVSDLDAARGVALARLEDDRGSGADDVEGVVRRLMADRPGLFGASGHGTGGVMRSRAMGALTEAQKAAEEAKSSGDRRQLLRYLRLRRSAS